jgi:hypothetical protein
MAGWNVIASVILAAIAFVVREEGIIVPSLDSGEKVVASS